MADNEEAIIQIMPNGNVKLKDMEVTYVKRLKGPLYKVMDKIESECDAENVLFHRFQDFYRLIKASPDDYVYMTVNAFRGSSGVVWSLIELDKLVEHEPVEVEEDPAIDPEKLAVCDLCTEETKYLGRVTLEGMNTYKVCQICQDFACDNEWNRLAERAKKIKEAKGDNSPVFWK